MSTVIAAAIGEMMAKLHRHALHYHPQNYEGKRFDRDYFFGKDSWWHLKAEQHLGRDTMTRLQPALTQVSALVKVKCFGIKVTNLLPEPMDTPMRWQATPDFPKEHIMAPEEVADIILAVLKLESTSFISDVPVRKLVMGHR